jgi:hypothetical protein
MASSRALRRIMLGIAHFATGFCIILTIEDLGGGQLGGGAPQNDCPSCARLISVSTVPSCKTR